MALSVRFIPKPNRAALTANGRSYSSAGLAFVDVPFPDADAIHGDQATRVMVVGSTFDRPVNVPGRINWPPAQMFDTTVGAMIFLVPGSNPAQWVDVTGAAA